MQISARGLGIKAAAAAGLMLCGAPAFAQTTYYADGPNAGGAAVLNVQVTASVGGRCGFATNGAPNGSYDQPDFDTQGLNRDFGFTLNCTGPSRVGVVSDNGGLKTAGTAPTGYKTLAPYTVSLNLVGSGGTVTDSCLVANLAATATSPCQMRGPASTSAGVRVPTNSINLSGTYLRVSAPAYNPTSNGGYLVAGSYQDVLRVTVSAAL